MKFLTLFILTTIMLVAEDSVTLPAYAMFSILALVIALFFWGVHKAIKTQKLIYAWALAPFVALLFWMFFI
jgi:hypothetical protein